MLILFLVIFVVGMFLCVYMYKNIKKINKLKHNTRVVQNTQTYSRFTSNKQTEMTLEKQDLLLTKLREFDEKLALKVSVGVVLFLVVYMVNSLLNVGLSSATLGVVGIFFILLMVLGPGSLRKIIVDMRINSISKNIPMFVDLLAVCVQAGMNIESAIKFLEGNISNINKNFAPFLQRMIAKSEVSGLYSALDDLQEELPSTEIVMMCTTLKQSIKYGSALYDALISLSMEIRELELLKTEEAIGKLSAKMSVPLILFFMFPVIIIIAAPGIIKVMGGF